MSSVTISHVLSKSQKFLVGWRVYNGIMNKINGNAAVKLLKLLHLRPFSVLCCSKTSEIRVIKKEINESAVQVYKIQVQILDVRLFYDPNLTVP